MFRHFPLGYGLLTHIGFKISNRFLGFLSFELDQADRALLLIFKLLRQLLDELDDIPTRRRVLTVNLLVVRIAILPSVTMAHRNHAEDHRDGAERDALNVGEG